ncbi:alpha/beta hydrolase [Leucobacter salsicius]|uniref:alpha/beta hydrolase n=1 Tax=Leucobacter salsicius TaxID=664638 RepID=UPI00034DF9BD|nr:alpha/beta hydrolase [Leucobacter salsicius]
MRRGPLIGVILACAALAACLVAVLWRGDTRPGGARSHADHTQPQAAAVDDVVATYSTATDSPVTNVIVAGPAARSGATQAQPTGGINRVGSAEIPVRRYDPAGGEEPWAVLVWAHGGSFVRGGLDMPEADWTARQFAAAGMRVYSVDYVLASDTVKAPAPANDVAAVARWVARTEDVPLLIGGASAGAHLATLAALDRAEAAAAGEGEAAAALLLEYPTMHRVQRADAAIATATAGLAEGLRFDPDRIEQMYATHLGDAEGAGLDPARLVAGEIAAERLALLPPTVIVNAELDDLRASGEQFAEQLAMARVRVVEYTQAGVAHGYLNRPAESDEALASAQQTIDRFVAGARDALGG